MNLGCVIYKKEFLSGNLSADWHFEIDNKYISGTGKAIGEPGKKFEGKYIITYFNFVVKNSKPFDLFIIKKESIFILEWYQEEKLKCSGIGMLHDNILIAGWKNIIEQ